MEELKKSIFEELDDITEADEVMQEDKKIKKECKTNLKEGTSNFPTRSEFPLLVFYTYDEFYDKMRYDNDYPKEEDFEIELENGDFHIDYDAYEEARDAFEQDYWDKNRVCVLDEDDVERLEDKLYDFNKESERMAYDADVNEDGYQEYGNNLNLEDVQLTIGYGNYEGSYIDVDHEDYLDALEDDFKEQQILRFNNFLEELKKEFGLTKLGVSWGPASNGETGFKIIDESMKSDVTNWWKDVEKANDEMKWEFNIDNGDYEDVEAMHAAMFDMLDSLKEKGASELFDSGKKIYNKYAKYSKYNEALNESHDEDLYEKIMDVLDDYGILYGDIVDYGDRINLVGIAEEEWDEVVEAIKSELGLDVLVPDIDHEEFDDELIVLNEAKKKKPHEIVATGYDLEKSTAMINHALGSDCCENYDDLDEYDTDSYYNEEDVCVYQFPSSMTEEDIKGAKKYGLTYLGIVNDLGMQPGDYLVKGKYGDLKKYCSEYLDYIMHPYYLCKEEECDLEDILEAYEEKLEESYIGKKIFNGQYEKNKEDELAKRMGGIPSTGINVYANSKEEAKKYLSNSKYIRKYGKLLSVDEIGFVDDKLEETLRRYKIEYWVDEEARDQGFGDIAIETFDDLEDAKDFADKLFSDVASVEVLDTQDNDNVVYGRYPEDESLKENNEEGCKKELKEYNLPKDAKPYKTCGDKEYYIATFDDVDREMMGNKATHTIVTKKVGGDFDLGSASGLDFNSEEEAKKWIDDSCSLKEDKNDKIEFNLPKNKPSNDFEYTKKEYSIKPDEANESITILVKKNDLWEEFASIDNCPTKDMSEEDINNNYKELVEKLLEEKAYGLFLKVKDRDNKIVKDEKEPLMTGTRQECVEKKKQLEDTSEEDSYHNRNIYTVREL